MLESLDFSDVVDILKSRPNPEVTHYHHGSLPGLSWYLKTLVPNLDCPTPESRPIVTLIQRMTRRYPDKILVVRSAFNWNQELLGQFNSLWIRDGYDVAITSHNGSLSYRLVKQNKQSTIAIDYLNGQLNSQLSTASDQQKEELSLLTNAANILHNRYSESAQECRSNFKVITGGKI